MQQREPRDPAALTKALDPLAYKIRELLLEAGSVAAFHHITPEEKARFDLSLQLPGSDTFAAEQKLSSVFDNLAEHSVNIATSAVLHFVFKVNPLDGKQL